MNSLDAIIALIALMTCFGIMLGSISAQENNAKEATNSLKAKNASESCAGIIDSIYSNGAQAYSGEFVCGANENLVSASAEGKTKTTPIITTAKKEFYLEVKTLDHYK